MRLKYYGTAAAEGVPALYCDCDICKYSREKGGRNIRTRCQATVDESLLIDVCPDTLYHSHVLGLDLAKVEHLLITHNHSDHLHVATIAMRSNGYVKQNLPMLNIYGSGPSIQLINDELRKSNVFYRGNWSFNQISPFEKNTIGKYDVTAYNANHDLTTHPYIYEIYDGKKRLLYAHDTGDFPDETWQYLENEKPYFDLVSLDCTMGIADSTGHRHMNVNNCIEIKNRLLELGCADKNTIFVLNHFSHNGKVSYDSLLPIAEKEGFLVSYDGMEIEF